MNLRDLRYLIALADLRHFGKAADACFVSQPTLSTQVRKLEDELGVALVERAPRKVMLTAAGQDVVQRARRIVAEVEQMKEAARRSRDPESGSLRLGVFPTLGPYLLPHVVPQLRERFPQLELLLVEEKSDVLLQFTAVLARLISGQGNRVGAMVYGSQGRARVETMLPARGGRNHVLRLMQMLMPRPTAKEAVPAGEAATRLGDLLRSAGHDVRTVLDQHLGGREDSAIIGACQSELRALVTLDLDFGDIRLYPPEQYSGLIVLRPGAQDLDRILMVGRRLIHSIEGLPLAGRLWIVDEAAIRIRPGD